MDDQCGSFELIDVCVLGRRLRGVGRGLFGVRVVPRMRLGR